jgi:guanylate kinase
VRVVESSRGKLVVIAAPSGAGKTTLVHAVLQREPKLTFSVSYTTRPPRPTEIDGEDYFFVDRATFATMRERGEFVESARVFDHDYGSSRTYIDRLRREGRTVLLEIDWQGAQQIRENEPDSISIFIMPPSRNELERRLRGRATDTDSVVERRLADAVGDMGHWREFDYVVVNDDLDTATDALLSILRGEGERFATTQPEMVARVETVIAA